MYCDIHPSNNKLDCLMTKIYVFLIEPSNKQIICFDFGKQNSALPVIFFIPWGFLMQDLKS